MAPKEIADVERELLWATKDESVDDTEDDMTTRDAPDDEDDGSNNTWDELSETVSDGLVLVKTT